MTLTVEQRRELDLLRRKVREIEKPAKEARKRAQKAASRDRAKRVGLTSEGQRKPRVHDKAYLAHVRRQPCMLAGIAGETCEGHIDAAHLRYGNVKYGRRNPGMGRKPDDRWTLPLCRKHHTEQHAAGNEARWWAG